MRIAISPTGIKAVLPHGLSEQAAITFIESNKLRIFRANQKVVEQDKRLKKATELHYVSGATIPIVGRKVLLIVRPEQRTRTRVEYDGDLVVRVNERLSAAAVEKELGRKVEGWIKGQMQKEALEVAGLFGKRIGILPKGIKIKAQKKLWGSCGRNAIINLNWRLGLFPKKVFEYVVAHEMCHLRYMNHSKAFWKLLGSLMPEYEKYRAWLTFRGY
jgi:predicted metal-dependent hydrolase